MRKYFLVGAGAFLGAVTRYGIGMIPSDGYGLFPLKTLMINLLGSFILAFFITAAFEAWELDADIRLGIATGFLGAFTTFSTFCKESVSLMQNGSYGTALIYMSLSLFLGSALAYLGFALVRMLFRSFYIREPQEREGNK